jgi:hypothetical protein
MIEKLKDKCRLWFLSHVKHPEMLTVTDYMVIDFLFEAVPTFIGVIFWFTFMVWLYTFLLGKYGSEKIFILLGINILFYLAEILRGVTKNANKKV